MSLLSITSCSNPNIYPPSIQSPGQTHPLFLTSWLNRSKFDMFVSENCVNTGSKVVRHVSAFGVQWWAVGLCFPFLRESCWVVDLKTCPAACTILLSNRRFGPKSAFAPIPLCHTSHLAQISPQSNSSLAPTTVLPWKASHLLQVNNPNKLFCRVLLVQVNNPNKLFYIVLLGLNHLVFIYNSLISLFLENTCF